MPEENLLCKGIINPLVNMADETAQKLLWTIGKIFIQIYLLI